MSQKRFAGTAFSRRQLLKSGAAVAASTGMGAGLLGKMTRASALPVTLHVLQGSNFMRAIDQELVDLAAEFGTAHQVTVKLEFINPYDVLDRAIAALRAKFGPDVILLQWNQGWLFGDSFADVGDVVKAVGGAKIHKFNRDAADVKGVYRGVPYYNVGSAMTYNMEMLTKAGVTKLPDTYDDLLKVGTIMKKAGFPVGWCLGHTIGDGAFGNYPIVWSFGGAEVDEKGKVIVNSKETKTALEWFRQFWNDACDPGGMAWNDSSNNQAFLGETVSIMLNAASIYVKARADKNDKLAGNIRHTVAPAGPAGRFELVQEYNHHVPVYSKNLKLAKEWLTFLGQKPQYERMFTAGKGFAQGIAPEWDSHPMWKQDPIMEPYKDLTKYGRNMGYKGVFNRASVEVQAKYVIVDMLARSVQEGSDAAMQWAEKEMKLVYQAG
jgi:multiple sugar transport system substrate-binding protein